MDAFIESRGLADLSWLRAEALSARLEDFASVLDALAARTDALGGYARAASPVLGLWRGPDRVWLDYDNPGSAEFGEALRLAVNPARVVPWWLGRPEALPRFRGEALREAFLGFLVGVVMHDVTHLLIWIAHRRARGFETRYLTEELNATLWGSTMSLLAVARDPAVLPPLESSEGRAFMVEAAWWPIQAVHGRDFLRDPALMLSSGASLEESFGASPAALALLGSSRELMPEHPAAPLAYARFSRWTRENTSAPIEDEALLAWPSYQRP